MVVLRDIAFAALWLVAAVVFGIGTAGIVTGFGGAPGSPSRAELTWAGDRALLAGIAEATAAVSEIGEQVAIIDEKGRVALTALNARDVDLAQKTIEEGSTVALGLDAMAGRLNTLAVSLPGGGVEAALNYAPGPRAQRALLLNAASTTASVAPDWQRFAVASVVAERLATLLATHDKQTAAAAALGRDAKYAQAVAGLDASDATMAAIVEQNDELKKAADTTVLSAWIDRNAAYDKALRTLYTELVASKGKINATVRAAIAEEQQARGLLPPDTRALTVVMSEVARGGLQQALISIGDARGRLDEVIARLDAEAVR